MFKFLHAADIHLDSPMLGLDRYEGAPVAECRGASRRALGNLVRLAVEERVAFVLIVGDLYDGDWPDYNTGLFFCDQMARLRDAGIKVYLIRGNHDAANRMTRDLRPLDNVLVLSDSRPQTVTLDDFGVALHGQSYPRSAVEENLARTYPAKIGGLVNIGLLHTGVEGREGHARYAPCGDTERQRDPRCDPACRNPWHPRPRRFAGCRDTRCQQPHRYRDPDLRAVSPRWPGV